ncbi:MAG: 1-deoxy-D-xylulose-5-phosphate reductoisomerase [Ignavibacteria bacterium]|nr:1-deoxy-D-xylulose-5-phosphate reductoisomerase [Ignavibacteria bacterium]
MKKPRNIAILGSTGSIGCSSLEVIANFPDELRVTYLTANKNIGLLQEQTRRFRPRAVVVLEESNASVLREALDGTTEVLVGEEGLQEIVCREDVDIVLSSLVGFAGLKPTLHAIEAGKDIALANKETLVVAGEIIMKKVRKHGVRLLPVDSEHSAILQCIQGENTNDIERVILTASGGPFLNMNEEQFHRITVEQALNHPTWKMGNKITIDSATLMNKGLEVIEAFWLFGLPPEKIEVLIHPQSIIHSMVEFVDGSIKAQLSVPDMKIPIQYALMYPRRPASPYSKIDFNTLREMTFLRPDIKKFPCLPLAFRALQMGGTAPAVLNAANEVAVHLFLEERLSFTSIPAVIQDTLSSHTPIHNTMLQDVIKADSEARDHVRQQTVAIHQ